MLTHLSSGLLIQQKKILCWQKFLILPLYNIMARQCIKTKKEAIVNYWFFEKLINESGLSVDASEAHKDAGGAVVNIVWRDVTLFLLH